MPELIDKQAVRLLESDADAYTENWNDDYEKGFCDAINKALELPTIEADIDRAAILRLCNAIEMVIVTVCDTGYTLQDCDVKAIMKRTKAIRKELTGDAGTD